LIGNKLEQEIIRLYNQEITALYSINQIAVRLGKAYPYINRKVTSLIHSEILNMTVIGRSHLCSVNLKSDETNWLLALNEIRKKEEIEKKDKRIAEIIKTIHNLRKAITIHLAVKVGNRLLFVLENKEDKSILEKSISLTYFKIQTYTKQEFLQWLLVDKDILQNHVILFGYEKYFHYLEEIGGKLRIKYSSLLK